MPFPIGNIGNFWAWFYRRMSAMRHLSSYTLSNATKSRLLSRATSTKDPNRVLSRTIWRERSFQHPFYFRVFCRLWESLGFIFAYVLQTQVGTIYNTGCPIWSETLVGVTYNLNVPLSAQFCLGRWVFGRIGWAARKDGGTSKTKLTQPRSLTRWDTL